jgi:uncharacterized protein (DUF58 family)
MTQQMPPRMPPRMSQRMPQTTVRAGAPTGAETGFRIREVLTTRGRAFMAAGLTLTAGGFLLGFTDITRVGVLLSALPLLAGMSARRTRRASSSLVVTRTVHPSRLTVDQSARVSVVVRNTSRRRTQLQLAEEHVHRGLGDRPRFLLPAMEPGDIREVHYQIRSAARGRYRLGPLTVRRRDPYGLATITASLPGFADILVLPHVEILGHGHPRADGVGAEGAIPHMIVQHGEDDVAVRTYHDGDDLRRIHWPATAHHSELMVRQEDHPARRRALIVLDSREAGHQGSGSSTGKSASGPGKSSRSASGKSSGTSSGMTPASGSGMSSASGSMMSSGSGSVMSSGMSSFEWAVTAAASIAAHLSKRHYTLHLATSETTVDGQTTRAIEIDDALASLAMAQPGSSPQLDEVLRWAQPSASIGGLVIAIMTDHDEAVLRRTAALRQPAGTGLLILLDTATFAGPRTGAPSERTVALAAMVAAAGWSTCIVGSGMTVGQVWKTISTSSAAMVGDGR